MQVLNVVKVVDRRHIHELAVLVLCKHPCRIRFAVAPELCWFMLSNGKLHLKEGGGLSIVTMHMYVWVWVWMAGNAVVVQQHQ